MKEYKTKYSMIAIGELKNDIIAQSMIGGKERLLSAEEILYIIDSQMVIEEKWRNTLEFEDEE